MRNLTAVEPDLELLRLIVDLEDALPESRALDTESIARAKFEAAMAARRSAMFVRQGPWYGLSDELSQLRRAGFVTVDPGVAEYRLPNQPASTPTHFYIAVSPGGRAAAKGL